MKITTAVKGSTTIDIEIDEYEAFRLLCRTLEFGIIVDDPDLNAKLWLEYDEDEQQTHVYWNNPETGEKEMYDENGPLYEGLNKTACGFIPNLPGRERWEDYLKYEK